MRPPSSKTIFTVALVGLVIFAAVFSLLKSGYPKNHDLELYPIWQTEFDAGIREGHFLPRWSPDVWISYGSPLFNFTQPLFFYLAEIWHLIGFGIITSIKLTLIFATLAGGWFMYLFTRQYFGRLGALFSASVFMLAPYHIGLVYDRGAFSEYLAISLAPLCLYAAARLGRDQSRRNFFLLAGAIAALVLSHNISMLIFLPPILLFILLFSKRNIRACLVQAAAVATGFLLSAFYWVPAFFERQYLNLDNLTSGPYDFHNNFSSLKEILISNYWSNGVVFLQVSFVASFICLVSAVLIVKNWRRQKAARPAAYFLLLSVSALIATTAYSRPAWEAIPLLKYIQFPWRFLGLFDLSVAFLAGLIVWPEVQRLFSWLAGKIRPRWTFSFLPISGALIVLLILGSTDWLGPLGGYFSEKADPHYQPKQALIDQFLTVERYNTFGIKTAIFPRYNNLDALEGLVEKNIYQMRDRVLAGQTVDFSKTEVINGEAAVAPLKLQTTRQEYTITARTEARIRINTFYFPGWTAELNTRPAAIVLNSDYGLMEFIVPPGRHTLVLNYLNTTIRAVADLISFVTLIGLGSLLLWRWAKETRTSSRD